MYLEIINRVAFDDKDNPKYLETVYRLAVHNKGQHTLIGQKDSHTYTYLKERNCYKELNEVMGFDNPLEEITKREDLDEELYFKE
jgi:hypothetical protein